jgi:hypothetical protein
MCYAAFLNSSILCDLQVRCFLPSWRWSPPAVLLKSPSDTRLQLRLEPVGWMRSRTDCRSGTLPLPRVSFPSLPPPISEENAGNRPCRWRTPGKLLKFPCRTSERGLGRTPGRPVCSEAYGVPDLEADLQSLLDLHHLGGKLDSDGDVVALGELSLEVTSD